MFAVQQQQQQQLQQQQQQAGAQQQQQAAVAPREKIWTGVVEWIEKAKSTDQPKVTRQVPCHVTANLKDNEAEM